MDHCNHDHGPGSLNRRAFLQQGAAAGSLAVLPLDLGQLLAGLDPPGGVLAARALPPPPIITRAQWGADESLRRGTPEFAPITRMVVHHTFTPNNDPDPAARVRAILEFHTVVRGWNDIGYNFLIDHRGRVYEGRWARPYGPSEVHDGEDGQGNGVIGAHAAGYNTGSVGVALLGDFTVASPTAAAVDALVAVLAWKAAPRRLDPEGSYGLVPVLAPHREVGQTSCPGRFLAARLPEIRSRVAEAVGSGVIGYRVLGGDGTVASVGPPSLGDLPGTGRSAPARSVVSTPSGDGYWISDAGGAVYSFGDAQSFGSMGGARLAAPVVGMAAHPSGRGYWLVASDGGVFSFGEARFFGSTGAIRLAAPVVGMAAHPSGRGYWLVASDGGVFSFGEARFFGSMGGARLAAPVVGMAAHPSGRGYWLVASDGGVFSFGEARFFGSTGGIRLVSPVVGMAAHPGGGGYWLVAGDGGVFTFGTARFFGSAVGRVRDARGLAVVDRAG